MFADSLCLEVRGFKNVYKQLEKRSDLFDFSNLPPSHFLYSLANKLVAGKLKDEMKGEVIHEFVGLRSKMYSLLTKSVNIRKAKGISAAVTRRKLKHKHFKDCLFAEIAKTDSMKRIGSYKHQVYTFEEVNYL